MLKDFFFNVCEVVRKRIMISLFSVSAQEDLNHSKKDVQQIVGKHF